MSNVISGTAQLPSELPSQLTQSQPGPILQRVNIKGDPGPRGSNAFTFTTAYFTMPAADDSTVVVVSVEDSTWAGIGQLLFIETAGTMLVHSYPTDFSIGLINPSAETENASPGSVISPGSKVSPGASGGGGGGGGGDTTTYYATLDPNNPMVIPAGNAVINIQGTVNASASYTFLIDETEAFAPKLFDFSNVTLQPANWFVQIQGQSATYNNLAIDPSSNPPIYYNFVYWDGNDSNYLQIVPVVAGPAALGGIPSPPLMGNAVSFAPNAMVYGDTVSDASAIQFTGTFQSGHTYTINFNPNYERLYMLPMVLDFSQCVGNAGATVTVSCSLSPTVSITPGSNTGNPEFNPYYLLYWDGNNSHAPVVIPILASAPDAAIVPYEPSDTMDWSPTPSNAGPALDQLASRVQALQGTGLTANKYGVSTSRGSATGSGRLYICSDGPVAYFDDPNTTAWIAIPLETSSTPPNVSNYSVFPAGDIYLAAVGDALRAVPAVNNANTICALVASAALGATSSWIVTLSGTCNPIPFQTYPDFGICVTDGTANGSNVYGLSTSTNGAAVYVHQQNLVIGSSTRNANNGEQSPTPPIFIGNGRVHFRLLNDGVAMYFQVSSDGLQWVNWYVYNAALTGLTHYGFYFSSAAGSYNYNGSMIYENALKFPTQYIVSAVTPTQPAVLTIGPHTLTPGDCVSIQGASGGANINTSGGGTNLSTFQLISAVTSTTITVPSNGAGGYNPNSAQVTLLNR